MSNVSTLYAVWGITEKQSGSSASSSVTVNVWVAGDGGTILR